MYVYFRHQTNEHLTLCYLLGQTYKPAHSSATLESRKSTRSTTYAIFCAIFDDLVPRSLLQNRT